MTRTVTVGCDGSPQSMLAALWAAQIAERDHAALSVVAV